MTVVSKTVLDDLEGEPCLKCSDGTLERETIDGNRAVVCNACAQTRAVLWGCEE